MRPFSYYRRVSFSEDTADDLDVDSNRVAATSSVPSYTAAIPTVSVYSPTASPVAAMNYLQVRTQELELQLVCHSLLRQDLFTKSSYIKAL